jgi:hypothetical protein
VPGLHQVLHRRADAHPVQGLRSKGNDMKLNVWHGIIIGLIAGIVYGLVVFL